MDCNELNTFWWQSGSGAGNDPKPLRLAFHQGPTFINACYSYCAIW